MTEAIVAAWSFGGFIQLISCEHCKAIFLLLLSKTVLVPTRGWRILGRRQDRGDWVQSSSKVDYDYERPKILASSR
ncbi:MAG: hypothetical protein KKB51_21730 [Candidatus Riflebacteria bacterium]|nr:hypothetical protein [Candidatus Riflebacteria bacterium]